MPYVRGIGCVLTAFGNFLYQRNIRYITVDSKWENMTEQYMSNKEYETHFEKLWGLRSKIAMDLPIKPGMYTLDVATGEGLFAIEVAKRDSSLKIIGIDISRRAIQDARRNVRKQNFQDRIEIAEMDAAKMRFQRGEFDMAINFTGLEEIHMTRGEEGVQETFLEVNRVLKPESHFCFVVMPPEEMESMAQKTEVALFSYVCGATWLNGKKCEAMLEKANFKSIWKRSYYTGMKFTPQQAWEEIRYTIKNVPKIYGIDTPTFEDVWDRFGQDIEENGLGCYSKVVLMIVKKAGG